MYSVASPSVPSLHMLHLQDLESAHTVQTPPWDLSTAEYVAMNHFLHLEVYTLILNVN